jgi:hypothetical protein
VIDVNPDGRPDMAREIVVSALVSSVPKMGDPIASYTAQVLLLDPARMPPEKPLIPNMNPKSYHLPAFGNA